MLDRRVRARLARSRSAVLGAGIVTALALFAWVAPLATSHDPLRSDFVHGLSPSGASVGPTALFWLGADRIFRDLFVRLAWAGRLSLFIAVSATAIATVIGTTVGVAAGWREGQRVALPWPLLLGIAGAAAGLAFAELQLATVVLAAGLAATALRRFAQLPVDIDGLLMRFVDVMLAFPFLLLVMAIGAALDGTSAVTVLATLGATGWLGIARVLRAKTIQVRSADYIIAARALGQSTWRILTLHLLRNIAGTLIVTATMQVAQMIAADSALSYLGVGISPPTPTWGRMLYEGHDYVGVAPWLVAAPGAAILLAVWGFNMLGEGLRDALDAHDA